jgi:hypothetical protein
MLAEALPAYVTVVFMLLPILDYRVTVPQALGVIKTSLALL